MSSMTGLVEGGRFVGGSESHLDVDVVLIPAVCSVARGRTKKASLGPPKISGCGKSGNVGRKRQSARVVAGYGGQAKGTAAQRARRAQGH